MAVDCIHIQKVRDDWPIGDEPVCAECNEIGSEWVSLRECLSCGHVGCCDSSPHQHATAHHRETSHPCVRALMHDQNWVWCYFDEIGMRYEDGEWIEVDVFLEVGFGYMKEHLAAGGEFEVDESTTTENGYPLGKWLVEMRKRSAEGELSNAQRRELTKLKGWAD